MLSDQSAVQILDTVEYDFSTVSNNINPITQLAWAARSVHTDRVIQEFIRRYPDCTVVNLGCGLDTTFSRIDNGAIHWFDVDLPDVIKLRTMLIPESERCTYIADSIHNDAWMRNLNGRRRILFTSAGVFYYFEEKEIEKLFERIGTAFPGSEIFFDIASPLGVRVSNEKVLKAGGMAASAVLKWSVTSPGDFLRWNPRYEILDYYPMFKGVKRSLRLDIRLGAFMSDVLKVMSMVHIRFPGA